jgi:hypothetical protein
VHSIDSTVDTFTEKKEEEEKREKPIEGKDPNI